MSSEIFDFDKIFKVLVNSGFVLNLADFVESLALFPPEAQIPRAGSVSPRALAQVLQHKRVGKRVATFFFGQWFATLASARKILIIHLMNFWFWRDTLSQKIFLATARKIFKKPLDIGEEILYIVLVVVRGCGCSN